MGNKLIIFTDIEPAVNTPAQVLGKVSVNMPAYGVFSLVRID
jgi:hypothetical protein